MISSLRLQQFRSYTDSAFEFGPKVNIIVGANASGKTNLLEAVLLLCGGSSFRVSDGELLLHGSEWSRLDGEADGQIRTLKLVKKVAGQLEKEYVIDEKVHKRPGLTHSIPVVLFEPEHLRILSGSPEMRREFFDGLLAQTVSGFTHLRSSYKRTLAQRNALLKRGLPYAKDQLFAWNVRLSDLGGQIAVARSELIALINFELSRVYSDLAQTASTVMVRYEAMFPIDAYSSSFLKKLEHSAELDSVRGFTASGPHRENIAIDINTHAAALTASRGESRTLVLALKMLELAHIERVRERAPLLLLDDVFSELDGSRRRALTEFLAPYQTFITTTDADVVVQHFLDNCTIIPIEKASKK
jgi:DNA replication and repair protein RecF